MRRGIFLLALAGLVSLTGTACSHLYNVRARPAPGAMLTSFKTFHLVPTVARPSLARFGQGHAQS